MKSYKEMGEHDPFKGRNKSREAVPLKDLMADIGDKNFKTTVLKMYRTSRK